MLLAHAVFVFQLGFAQWSPSYDALAEDESRLVNTLWLYVSKERLEIGKEYVENCLDSDNNNIKKESVTLIGQNQSMMSKGLF